MSAVTVGATEPEPEPKRRRLLDAGGPIEDDKIARRKMRKARVREILWVNRTPGEFDGFDPNNVADVKRTSATSKMSEVKPTGYFAGIGHLPMMRWLYVNGADTRDVDVAINFPMYKAALRGHLRVCKWLFQHGAAGDIKRRAGNGRTPLCASFFYSSTSEQRNVGRWLILNGALCKDDTSGDLDVELVKQDLDLEYVRYEDRMVLFEWADDLHRARTSFLLFLSGALSAPKQVNSTPRDASPVQHLTGKPGIRELIGDYVGFVRGREARITRQLTKLLTNFHSTA